MVRSVVICCVIRSLQQNGYKTYSTAPRILSATGRSTSRKSLVLSSTDSAAVTKKVMSKNEQPKSKDSPTVKSSAMAKFTCPVCYMSAVTPANMQSLSSSTHYQIDDCGKSLRSQQEQRATRSCHTPVDASRHQQIFTAATRKEIKRHMEMVHDVKQAYPCPLCVASFTTIKAFRQHLSCSHSGALAQVSLESASFEPYERKHFAELVKLASDPGAESNKSSAAELESTAVLPHIAETVNIAVNHRQETIAENLMLHHKYSAYPLRRADQTMLARADTSSKNELQEFWSLDDAFVKSKYSIRLASFTANREWRTWRMLAISRLETFRRHLYRYCVDICATIKKMSTHDYFKRLKG